MIALSLTVHENPRVVMELMSNIKFCYGDNAFLVVHVSAEAKEAFYRHAAARNIRLFDDRIFWNDLEISTKWGNALPMQVANYIFLKTRTNLKFSHFQIMSPANLIIACDLDKYINQYDIVLRKTAPTTIGWMWDDKAAADPKYAAFMSKNNLTQRLCARVDGMAVRDEIFGDFIRRLLEFYSILDMQSIDPTYPQEETMLPTFLEQYRNFGFKFGEARAKTFEPNEPILDLPKLQAIIEEGKIAYLKRIAPQEDDPIRRHILQNFSYGRR